MCGQTVAHPMDTIKVRMQISNSMGTPLSGNPFVVFYNIAKNEGFRNLYKGLDSALFRQATYGTTRLGIYKMLFAYCEENSADGRTTLLQKLGCTWSAGWIGAFAGNPATLSAVRFQANSLLPKNQQRNYRFFGDALYSIIKNEGIFGPWRGVLSFATRAAIISMAQLGSFEIFKQGIVDFRGGKDDFTSKLGAIACTTVIMTATGLPMDNVMVKLMNKEIDFQTGKPKYSGMMNCISTTLKQEGISGFYTGFKATYLRDTPHTVVTLLALDFLTNTIGPGNVVTK